MIVGVCRVSLSLPGNNSLKGKRQIVRSVRDRLRAKFNVSVAEVAEQDVYRRATLGVALVGNESGHLYSRLDKIINTVEGMQLAPIVNYQVELLHFGDDLEEEMGSHWEPEE